MTDTNELDPHWNPHIIIADIITAVLAGGELHRMPAKEGESAEFRLITGNYEETAQEVRRLIERYNEATERLKGETEL